MKPLDAPTGQMAGAETPAVFSRLVVLRERKDFLACAKGRYRHAKGLTLQARFRDDGDTRVRVGFTCSKKVGNAVARNRAKRRLREVARQSLPYKNFEGFDYVLIGKREVTATRDFQDLLADMQYALQKVHQ